MKNVKKIPVDTKARVDITQNYDYKTEIKQYTKARVDNRLKFLIETA